MGSPNGLWPIVSNEDHLLQILEATSKYCIEKRLVFMDILAGNEFKDWIKKKGSERKRKHVMEMRKKEDAENTHIKYGLSGNSIFLRKYDTYMDYWNDYKVWREQMSEWGQPLVIDMAWNNTVKIQQQKSLVFRYNYQKLVYLAQKSHRISYFFLNFQIAS